MSLTPEERSATNRRNAARSRGPVTEEGKARSRQNALKHGLRAEVLALPNEDPEVVRLRQQAWQDHYRPASPAAQHLVNQCVRATLLADRCDAYLAATLAQQVRTAEDRWEQARHDEVERLKTLLRDDPATAARLLKRIGHGCRWLIGRWERLEGLLDAQGCWRRDDAYEAIGLLGQHPERGRLGEEAFLIHLHSLVRGREEDPRPHLSWLFHPERMPGALQATYRRDALPAPARCLEELRRLIAEQLEWLRAEEAWLRETLDEPDRAEAAERASLLLEPGAARLYLRYHAEARTAFQRAFKELIAALKHDATPEGADEKARAAPADRPARRAAVVDHEAAASPSPSPNEPNPGPVAAASPNEPNPAVAPTPPAISPNEPNPAPMPDESATDPDALSPVPADLPAGSGAADDAARRAWEEVLGVDGLLRGAGGPQAVSRAG
jgi:hypothetical protein